MKHSESITTIAAALVKASGEMKAIVKDSTNPAFKSSYASLEATVDAVRPVLSKHGLAVMQGAANPETDEGILRGFNVETVVIHSSGEWLSNVVYIPVEKPTPQGAVSALSYGRRAGLRAVFTLADTDDDGETAQHHAPRQAARPAASPSSAPAAPRGGTGPTMPFGKTKGQLLASLPINEVESALAWAQEKGKFVEFQAEAEAEVNRRAGDEYNGFEDDASQIPF